MTNEASKPQDAALEAEAEARWGETEAWAQSRRRTRRYGAAEWARIKEEGAATEAAFAELLRAGAQPTSEPAMDLAEAARMHIHRWFYDCPAAIHVNLAAMYEADPRFKAHYDDQESGLAIFVAEAIRANARRSAGSNTAQERVGSRSAAEDAAADEAQDAGSDDAQEAGSDGRR